MTILAEDLEKLKDLKVEAAAAKKAWQKKKDEQDEWERHCYDRMDAEKTASHKSEAGVGFAKYEQTFAQIQDREKFIEWALENDPDLVQHREREDLVNQLARQRLDDGQGFPPGLSYRQNFKVGVRGANKVAE